MHIGIKYASLDSNSSSLVLLSGFSDDYQIITHIKIVQGKIDFVHSVMLVKGNF